MHCDAATPARPAPWPPRAWVRLRLIHGVSHNYPTQLSPSNVPPQIWTVRELSRFRCRLAALPTGFPKQQSWSEPTVPPQTPSTKHQHRLPYWKSSLLDEHSHLPRPCRRRLGQAILTGTALGRDPHCGRHSRWGKISREWAEAKVMARMTRTKRRRSPSTSPRRGRRRASAARREREAAPAPRQSSRPSSRPAGAS